MADNTDETREQLLDDLADTQTGIAELEAADDSGRIDDSVGVISGNTQVQETLRQSEARFRNIIDASPVPYALNDEQQNITYLNPAFIRTFGYDRDDIPRLADWWPKAYPDSAYRHWVASTWQVHLDKARKSGEPFEALELNIRCKDNSKRTVLASAASLSESFTGNHLVILYDITERKQRDHELREALTMLENVINSTPDLIFVKNRQLQTVLCNTAYARAVGKSREAMYGNTDIENGWDPALVLGNPAKGIRGYMHDDKDALSGIDVRNPNDPATVDGDIRVFDTHKLPLCDSDGTIFGVLSIARDFTERKKSEDQIEFLAYVEDENMLEPLRMHQCDEVQGYYFARPMPADEFSLYLSATREV